MLTWGGFSGNSKKDYITKLQWKQFFFVTFTGHLAYVKVTWSFFNVLKPPRNTSYVAGLKFKIFTKETRIYKNNSCNKRNMRKPNNNRRHNLSLEEKFIF